MTESQILSTAKDSVCSLSNGGEVRGLSTLYILKNIMDRLNHERKKRNLAPDKPCDVFDLIGGTSTGGYVGRAGPRTKHD